MAHAQVRDPFRGGVAQKMVGPVGLELGHQRRSLAHDLRADFGELLELRARRKVHVVVGEQVRPDDPCGDRAAPKGRQERSTRVGARSDQPAPWPPRHGPGDRSESAPVGARSVRRRSDPSARRQRGGRGQRQRARRGLQERLGFGRERELRAAQGRSSARSPEPAGQPSRSAAARGAPGQRRAL